MSSDDDKAVFVANGVDQETLYSLAQSFFTESGNDGPLTRHEDTRLRVLAKLLVEPLISNDLSTDIWTNEEKIVLNSVQHLSQQDILSLFMSRMVELYPKFAAFLKIHLNAEQRLEMSPSETAEREEPSESDPLVTSNTTLNRFVTSDEDRERMAAQEDEIRQLLNQQSEEEFRKHAQQQHPGNAAAQDALIAEMQEQQFQQYMQLIYDQLLRHQQEQYDQLLAMANQADAAPKALRGSGGEAECGGGAEPAATALCADTEPSGGGAQTTTAGASQRLATPTPTVPPPILPASVWTCADVDDFKRQCRQPSDGVHGVLHVSSLDTATIKVPTHPHGRYITWEFATDYYDLGFGVYFEWTLDVPESVAIQTTESDDELDDEDEAEANGTTNDPEAGSRRQEESSNIDEIVPIYRRDCHQEVYCGSHLYPGRGVYHLKFDNSFSLFRSKTVYYRVFYIQ